MSNFTITANSENSEITVTIDLIVIDLAEIQIARCLGEDDDPEDAAHSAVIDAVRAAVEQAYPGIPVVVSYDWEANDRQQHASSVRYDANVVSGPIRHEFSLSVEKLQAEVDSVVSDAIARCIVAGAWEGAPTY